MRSNYINELEDFYEIGSFKDSNANAAVLKDKEHIPHESDEACPLPDDGIAEDTAPAVGSNRAYARHNPYPDRERKAPDRYNDPPQEASPPHNAPPQEASPLHDAPPIDPPQQDPPSKKPLPEPPPPERL